MCEAGACRPDEEDNNASCEETDEPDQDGIDANCDLKELCYVDADDDGHGGSVTQPISDLTCNAPGFLPTSSDCDDTDPLLTTEERLWFADLDNDGLGNPNIHELACRPPAPTGWVDGVREVDRFG